MKRASLAFLQGIVVLIGIAAVAFLLWEPHVEGRNIGATLFEIYFTDPFLAYAYIASIPFFVALYQTFRVLGYAGKDISFSGAALRALRVIQYCGMIMIGFVVVGEMFLLSQHTDDRPPAIMMGVLITLISIAMIGVARMFERTWRSDTHST